MPTSVTNNDDWTWGREKSATKVAQTKTESNSKDRKGLQKWAAYVFARAFFFFLFSFSSSFLFNNCKMVARVKKLIDPVATCGSFLSYAAPSPWVGQSTVVKEQKIARRR